MPTFPRRAFAALPLLALLEGLALAAPDDPAPVKNMAVVDHVNLERNLRWILARERAEAARGSTPVKARVGVFADAGSWHVGAHSVVDALEGAGVPCRVLDRSRLTSDGFADLDALVIPGGWAGFQVEGMGALGVAAIRAFVEGGGRCLGVCAGAYALARDVKWIGTPYTFHMDLFDGLAAGPVEGLAKWPDEGPVRLTITPEGKARGLAAVGTRDVLYYGGPEMIGGTNVVVLAKFSSGAAALVSRRVGKGEVILSSAHLERPSPVEGTDASPPPPAAGAWLKALLLPGS